MKKIDTFQTFARGAKSLVAILLVMLMAVSSLFAQTQQYSLVTEDQTDWSGTYLITAAPSSGDLAGTVQALTGISTTATKYGTLTDITSHVTGSIIASNAETDALTVTIVATTNGTYTMNLNGSGYLGWLDKNTLVAAATASTDNYEWNISFSNEKVIITNAHAATRKLQYNVSSPRFACYTSDQASISLYKLEETSTPEPPTPVVLEPTWVSCDQVGIFNTQVTGLVPTCATVGDSTVFHFAYTDAFEGYPTQNPNTSLGAQSDKVYVDIKVARPNDNITGIKYGDNIINFADINGVQDFTLGAPYFADLTYVPVATVNGEVTEGNATDRNWTMTYEWCNGNEVVAIQKLNILVDAAPVVIPDLDVDSIATLPYTYNFDEGTDPYFKIENGTATNKWYTGQVEGFDNNKLYISSNNGVTNKFDRHSASNVVAYRDVMIPETGAVLSFDYRVNGHSSYAYLKINVNGNEVAKLAGENDWTSFSYDISGEMAGVVRVEFNWVNVNADASEQFPAAIDNISIIETPCPQPFNLTAEVEGTLAAITWEAVEGQTAWNFQYKLADHSEWYTISTTNPSMSLNGLQGNSNYEMRVQAVCGENLSAWTEGTFTVACQEEVEGVCVDQPTCANPTDLTVSDITTNSAVLTWTAGAENQAFIVEYMAEGATEWTSTEVNDNTITLNELTQLTNYSVKVKANCGDYNLSDVLTAEFRTEGLCANVTNLQFSNMSNTTTLTWEAGSSERNWLVQFKPADASEEEWISIEVSQVAMTTFGGLLGNTEYVARVKALCDPNNEENQSEWVTLPFTSGCAAKDIPFTEDFENSFTRPDCWDNDENFGFSGNYGSAYSKTADDPWLMSPVINIPAENTTYLVITSYVLSGEGAYTVLASYRGTREDRFEEIYNGIAATSSKQYIALPDIYKGKGVNFKIVAHRENIFFDAVEVNQCPFIPSNLTASNITGTTVDLAWEADEAVTNFQVRAGEQTWDVENANQVTIENLDYSTAYSFQVFSNCGNGNYSGDGSNIVNVTTKPACSEPTNLQYSIMSNGSYEFTWNASVWTLNENTEYVLGYKAEGESDYTEIESTYNQVAFLNLTNHLQYQTTYTVAVKAVCSEEHSSGWSNTVTFTTPCAPKTLPYTENFEETASIPECWTQEYIQGSHDWVIYNYSSNGGTGSNAACFKHSTTNTETKLITPAFDLVDYSAVQLRFKHSQKVWSSDQDELRVYYRSSAASSWVLLAEYTNDISTVTEEMIVLPTEALTASCQIAFQALDKYGYNVYVDDVIIEEAPTCYVPSISVSGTTATITASTNGNEAQSYDLKIGEDIVNVPSTPTTVDLSTLFTLESNTDYEVSVRANCGGEDNSEWSEPVSFRTPCLALALPYTEDFESYTTVASSNSSTTNIVMPDCWTSNWTATPSSSNYCPKITNTTSYNPNGSGKFLYFMAGGSYYSYYQNPTMVVLPEFNVDLTTAMISFRARCNNTNYTTYGKLYLGYVSTNNEFTSLKEVTCATSANAPLQTIMLNEYEIPEGAKLAFKADYIYSSTYSAFHVGIDDIAVKLIPTCFGATIAVNGTNATITPSTNGDAAQSYNLKIGEDIVNVPSTPTTVDLSTLFTLEANTNYEVSVQAVCGEGNESEWSAAVPFTTPCLALSLPYTEGFEDYEGKTYSATNGVVPDCWGASSTGTVAPHVIVSGGSYAYIHTGTKALTFYGSGNCYATLPLFETPISSMFMNFWMRTEHASNGTLSLGYITAEDNNMNTFTQIEEFSNTQSGVMVTPDLTQVPSEAYRLVFRWYCASQWSCCIDDVNIEFIPSCGTPTLTVSGTTATIAQSSIGTPESYKLKIGEDIVENVTELTVDLSTLFTLEANTNYEVSVQAVCGENDESEWSAAVPFTTPCAAMSIFPWNEDFESSTTNTVPNCWDNSASTSSTISSNNPHYIWGVYQYGGNNMIRMYNYFVQSGTALINTPVITLPSTGEYILSFDYSHRASCGEFKVKVKEDGTTDFVELGSYTSTGSNDKDNPGTFTEAEPISLAAYAGKSIVLQFFSNANFGSGAIFVDNIKIDVVPTCFVPNNLQVSDIYDNTAVLTWETNSSNPDAVNYVVEYKAAADEAWQTAATVSELTYTLTNLTASTDYLVRVKTDCGNEDESAYTDEEAFTTLCPYGYYNGNAVVCPDSVDFAITSINSFADACDIDGKLTISVKNMGYMPVSAFEAYYQINEETPIQETVTLPTPIALLETAEYTFIASPAFVSGANTLTAWVELADDVDETNNSITSAPITVLDPETVPYEEDFWGVTVNHGWNNIDANNDGITMNLNNNIKYSFNDTIDADDWMMSPCIEMPAGVYTVSYEYWANSAMPESFEVYYGNGAHIADMTNAVATHNFNNTTVETVTNTITIAADGVYNFGFHATSSKGNMGFNIGNFKVKPVINVVVESDTNGIVTPNGTIAVNYGENLILSLVPNTYYHVGGVEVDGVQVVPEDGTGANFMLYTLENVTEPHTVFVDFKLEFKIYKEAVNYRADQYTEKGGVFLTPNDTTIDPTPIVELMQADEHYHLNKLMLSLVAPGNDVDVTDEVELVDPVNRIYSYTTDTLTVANYFLTATFRRDTVDIKYNVLTGQGSADDSETLTAGANYTTWVDYSIYNDVNHTSTFVPADNYYIVDVIVNGESKGRKDSYEFLDVTETQNVDLKFGRMITTAVSNYNTYDEVQEFGTLTPDTQYVAEFDPMTVTGHVAEHFHLYQLLVNGVDRIDEVVFGEDPHDYSFTMNSVNDNYVIEAVIKVDTFAIIYHVMNGQGYADESDLLDGREDVATYYNIHNYGDNWYSTITPATGYSIANVTLDGQNLYTASNYQFNYIEASHAFDIVFAPNIYTITTNAFGNGTVSEGASFTYTPGEAFNYAFNATAEEGYYIASITINNTAIDLTGVEGTFDTIFSNVTENYNINVIFQMHTYTMNGTVASYGGTITPSGTQIVNYGANVTYEINALEGYYIYQIFVDDTIFFDAFEDPDQTVSEVQENAPVEYEVPFLYINDNHKVVAKFLPYKYSIDVAVDENGHGSINGMLENTRDLVQYGDNMSYTFDPDPNYQVVDVVIDGVSMGAITSYEFIHVTDTHDVVVSFGPIMYTLTATSNIAACTITPADTTVQAGKNVNYTLTVATGYRLENVLANGEEVTVNNNTNTFTIEDVQSNYTIFANFVSERVTVTVAEGEHYTITPGTQTYAYGATPSYMIVPEVGYEITEVTAGNAIVEVTYNNGIGTFTLDTLRQDVTLSAEAVKKHFTITVIAPEHGTITPADTTVEYGDNVTFTITPDDYYIISDVKVDGSSRGALSTYTFYNVTSNHTITAVFEADCQMPTNLVAMDIDTSSATLTWAGTALSYEVRYKAVGAVDYTYQTVNNTTSLSLSGLTPNTLYGWGVRAICGDSLASDWAVNAFTTRAVPATPVDPGTGIANAELMSVKVYSYQNNVYVVNEEGVAISNINIYDIYGKQVYTGKVLSSPEVISLNVANGNYIVRLATENGMAVYKVAIVR